MSPVRQPVFRGLSWAGDDELAALTALLPGQGSWREIGELDMAVLAEILERRPDAAADRELRLWTGDARAIAGGLRFDAAVVAGESEYQHVLADLRLAARLLSPGGFIVVSNRHWPVVAQVTKRFADEAGFAMERGQRTIVILRRRT